MLICHRHCSAVFSPITDFMWEVLFVRFKYNILLTLLLTSTLYELNAISITQVDPSVVRLLRDMLLLSVRCGTCLSTNRLQLKKYARNCRKKSLIDANLIHIC